MLSLCTRKYSQNSCGESQLELSVSDRVVLPPPEPPRAESQLFQVGSGRVGFASLPEVRRAAPCRNRAPSRVCERSLRGQKRALGSVVWGNHHPPLP